MSTVRSPGAQQKSKTFQALSGPTAWVDDRVGLATLVKKNVRKAFPDHWSFLLGEIALYSFIVLLLSGTFLAVWFQPSMSETTYTGSYDRLYGVDMSMAYASTLDISFDVRGGLLMRQIHHWAAALFLAAMLVHMLRVFFTKVARPTRSSTHAVGPASAWNVFDCCCPPADRTVLICASPWSPVSPDGSRGSSVRPDRRSHPRR